MIFQLFSNCGTILSRQRLEKYFLVLQKVLILFMFSLRGTVIVSFLLMLVLREAREKRSCLLFTLEGFGLNYFLT